VRELKVGDKVRVLKEIGDHKIGDIVEVHGLDGRDFFNLSNLSFDWYGFHRLGTYFELVEETPAKPEPVEPSAPQKSPRLTRRDLFAAHALRAFLQNALTEPAHPAGENWIVSRSAYYADALIAELDRTAK
jgi:hypothetical protein